MSDRESNNAIEHAIAEWSGANAGPAHGVLVRAANELLNHRAVRRRAVAFIDRWLANPGVTGGVALPLEELRGILNGDGGGK